MRGRWLGIAEVLSRSGTWAFDKGAGPGPVLLTGGMTKACASDTGHSVTSGPPTFFFAFPLPFPVSLAENLRISRLGIHEEKFAKGRRKAILLVCCSKYYEYPGVVYVGLAFLSLNDTNWSNLETALVTLVFFNNGAASWAAIKIILPIRMKPSNTTFNALSRFSLLQTVGLYLVILKRISFIIRRRTVYVLRKDRLPPLMRKLSQAF